MVFKKAVPKLNDPRWSRRIAWMRHLNYSSQKASGLMGDRHFRIEMTVVVMWQVPERLVDKMDLWW